MNTTITDDADLLHLKSVLRHIENVRDDCLLLGERLIAKGEKELGIELIGLGNIHDYNKIKDQLQFKYLRSDLHGTPEFKMAAQAHITSNPHHPEYWHGIEEMPRMYIAEMVCDWKSRSSEFGNDLRWWIKEKATEKYEFATAGRVYKEIKYFVDILLDPAFK